MPRSYDAHANFAYSAVATAPSPATTGTSMVLTAGTGARFPAVPYNLVVWPDGAIPTPSNSEIVRVTARSTDTLTISRTQEGTSARSVVVGDQVALAFTASKALADIESALPMNAKAFGAIGDGASHPLSGFYPSLVAAQVRYPFADNLNTNEIDRCAIQLMANSSNGSTGDRGYIPAGDYLFDQPVALRCPFILEGAGQRTGTGAGATNIRPSANWNGAADLLHNEQIDTGAPWAPNLIIRDINGLGNRPDGFMPAGLSFIRACGGESFKVDNCGGNNFTHAVIRLQKDQAGTILENLAVHESTWGVWLDDCAGPVTIYGISSDNCDNLINATNSTIDPNSNGGSYLSLTVIGMKNECNSPSGLPGIAAQSNNPIIRFTNMNEANLLVIGGKSSDVSAAAGSGTLNGGMAAGTAGSAGANITVNAGHSLPVPRGTTPYWAQVDSERITYTGLAGNVLSGVIRGADATPGAATPTHASGAALNSYKSTLKAAVEVSATFPPENGVVVGTGVIDIQGWHQGQGRPFLLRDNILGTQLENFPGGLGAQYPTWVKTNIHYRSRNIFYSPLKDEQGNDTRRGFELWGVNPTIHLLHGSKPASATRVIWTCGTGSPEGVVTAGVGSLYSRLDGGANTSLYVKQTGAGNTGWQPK